MVHAAIHDAVQAYDRRFEPYAVEITGASGSPVAAIAKAAHDVLVARFPAQTASLDTTYNAYLASHGGLSQNDPGVSVGQLAAAAIIALRANDGSWPANPPVFNGGTEPGEWRPTPPAFAPMAVAWLGAVTPFTLKDSTQFRVNQPPPDLSSRKYADDYNEVKALGALTNSARTLEQTDLAYFYADNHFLYGTGRSKALRIRISTTWATAPGSLPSVAWRWPTLSSPPGTASCTITSGGPSPPSSKATMTSIP
jgi:hypothetical protein